jgi:hypothetical protein
MISLTIRGLVPMTMQVTLHRQRFFCVPEYYKIPSQLPRILMARGKGGNIRLH